MVTVDNNTGEKQRQKRVVQLILLLATFLFVFTFSGCSPEKKLAKTFVKSHVAGPALVFMPDYVYKYNRKTDSLYLSGLSEEAKDSVLWFSSHYIRYIDDSLFLYHYQKGYVDELEKYGIHTFTGNNADSFFDNDSGGFVVNVAQIELEEQYYPFVDQIDVEGMTYSHHQQLNAMDISSWFEIKCVNNPDKEKVLFAENLLTDDIDGFFEQNPFTGQTQYFYHLDSLTVKKIYRDAYDLGRTYAAYTFDYLLNKYLDTHLPADLRSSKYFRYDPSRKVFFVAGDDRFDSVDE